MKLKDEIRDRLEQEADRRSTATVDELIDEAAQGVDNTLVEWLGPTMASRYWRRWVMHQCGRIPPAESERGESVLAQHGGGAA